MPWRYRTRLPRVAEIRSPGVSPRGKDAGEVDRVRGADDDRGFGTRLAVAAQGGDGLGVGELLAAEAGDEASAPHFAAGL